MECEGIATATGVAGGSGRSKGHLGAGAVLAVRLGPEEPSNDAGELEKRDLEREPEAAVSCTLDVPQPSARANARVTGEGEERWRGARRGAGLQVLGAETRALPHSSEGLGREGFPVVEGEHVVGPAVAREDSMRGPHLALHAPSDAEEGGEDLPGLR